MSGSIKALKWGQKAPALCRTAKAPIWASRPLKSLKDSQIILLFGEKLAAGILTRIYRILLSLIRSYIYLSSTHAYFCRQQ